MEAAIILTVYIVGVVIANAMDDSWSGYGAKGVTASAIAWPLIVAFGAVIMAVSLILSVISWMSGGRL